MRSRLLQLTKGNVEYIAPDIELDTEKLTGTLGAGKRHEIDVNIISKNGVPMSLFFYADDSRIAVSQPLSVGRFGKLSVYINTFGADLYERISGEIRILYNGGERALPYDFTVGFEEEALQDIRILTAEDFADFADAHPKEAVSLFGNEDFRRLPFMREISYVGLYKAYLSGKSEDFGMSEFIYAAGLRKKPLEKVKAAATANAKPAISLGDQLRSLPKVVFTDRARAKEIECRAYTLYLHYNRLLASGDPENPEFFRDLSLLLQDAPENPLTVFLAAFAYLKAGNPNEAAECLNSVSNTVQRDRNEKKDCYAVFLYLSALLSNDNERLDGARRLIHRFYLEGTFTNLLILAEFLTNPDYQMHRKAIDFLRLNYLKGFKNALCFQRTAYLWAQEKPVITLLTEYELLVLVYGMRHEILTEQRVFEVLSHELKDSRQKALYLQVLKLGWRKYGSDPFLQSLVNVYIQQNCIGPLYFKWYRAAVERNMTVPNLCSFYLKSRPEDFTDKLPEMVVRYYGFNGVPEEERNFLFENVLEFYRNDPGIFELYEEKIRAFAFDRLKAEDYDLNYLPAFNYLLESFDDHSDNVRLVRRLFSLYQVRTSEENVASLAVYYPELNRVDHFPVRHFEALIPVETDNAVIACVDENGVRFYDPNLKRNRACFHPELEEEIRKRPSESLAERVRIADEEIAKDARNSQVFLELMALLKEKPLTPFIKARFYEALIGFALENPMKGTDWAEVFSAVDAGLISKESRKDLCHVLIGCGHCLETMRLLRDYGDPGLAKDDLVNLIRYYDHPTQEEALLLSGICYGYYLRNDASDEMLAFLACMFVGLSSEMTALSNTLHKTNLPNGGLYARTMKVSLYVDNDTDTDRVFGWYSTLPTKEQDAELNRAYIVYRSFRYFRFGKKLPESVSELLKKEAATLPDICIYACLLDLSAHADSLEEQEKRVAEELLGIAVERNVVLGCMTKLANAVKFPAELEGCVFVEFRDPSAKHALLNIRMTPDGKEYKKEMQMPVPGVFTKSLVLFKDEGAEVTATMFYPDGSQKELKSVTLTSMDAAVRRGSQYDALNRLSRKCREYDLHDTASEMSAFLKKKALIDSVFGGNWKD